MTDKVEEIQKRVEAYREDIIRFMRDICVTPPTHSEFETGEERIHENRRKMWYD